MDQDDRKHGEKAELDEGPQHAPRFGDEFPHGCDPWVALRKSWKTF
jgi:hypothetical protein